ncbi:hypothetical protein VTG60DRAFT_3705 [Thermothelomyces hinnuleus]
MNLPVPRPFSRVAVLPSRRVLMASGVIMPVMPAASWFPTDTDVAGWQRQCCRINLVARRGTKNGSIHGKVSLFAFRFRLATPSKQRAFFLTRHINRDKRLAIRNRCCSPSYLEGRVISFSAGLSDEQLDVGIRHAGVHHQHQPQASPRHDGLSYSLQGVRKRVDGKGGHETVNVGLVCCTDGILAKI